ncbi:disease resistance protein RGA5-like [Aegilops tauschii subsp. strangulata]|nr:disease resistance protein PIK6-NP-like [Aegilops tauschii subsp. strangulata]
MAGSAQSAVGSLLGTLATVISDEAKLLGGVRGDVQFIKDEMESMNGFLLDMADTGCQPNNQVRSWMRQVREVAYDSQNCIDRYVQTFGASRPTAGLLGTVRHVPQIMRTMPDRHRIAMQIRELKSRVCEVGERRQRYGITVVPDKSPATRTSTGEDGAEEEDNQRHTALADIADLLDIDARAQQVIAWLKGQGDHSKSSSLGDIWIARSKYDELVVQMLKLGKGLVREKDLLSMISKAKITEQHALTATIPVVARMQTNEAIKVVDKDEIIEKTMQKLKEEKRRPWYDMAIWQEFRQMPIETIMPELKNKKRLPWFTKAKDKELLSTNANEELLHPMYSMDPSEMEEIIMRLPKYKKRVEQFVKAKEKKQGNKFEENLREEAMKVVEENEIKKTLQEIKDKKVLEWYENAKQKVMVLLEEATKVQEENEKVKKKVWLLLRHLAKEGVRELVHDGGWLMGMILGDDNPGKSTARSSKKVGAGSGGEEEEDGEGGGTQNKREKEKQPPRKSTVTSSSEKMEGGTEVENGEEGEGGGGTQNQREKEKQPPGKSTVAGSPKVEGGGRREVEQGEEDGEGGGRHNQTEKAKEPSAMEVQYTMKLIRWLKGVFGNDHMQAKLLAIVTPPVDASNPEAHKRATDLARTVYDHPDAASHFNFKVWVDAKRNTKRKERLQCILKQVQPHSIEDHQISTWDEMKLEQEIQQHLKGQKFLIILADHEDHSPWADITKALPTDHTSDSAIIVTPMIQQTPHLHGWYIASFFFLLKDYRCNVHFLSYLDTALKKATQLLDGSNYMEESMGIVEQILKRCRWDSFSTKMVLHALHANPHRSNEDWKKLLHRLKDFSTLSNANQIVRFCYDDLPSHYKMCLLYLSIFPQDSKIRRTSLVRRWVAENLIIRTHELNALDHAEHAFNALVARGLVLPCEIGPEGKVKFCKVHPHVCSFIAKMAREENVGNTGLLPEFAHCLSIRNGIQLQQLPKKRQATYPNTCCWRPQKPPASTKDPLYVIVTFLNSLLASSQLGLVKVLDLEGCNGLKKQNLKIICNKLFQLKYLSLRNTDLTDLPKEIDKLRYLETFDIRQTKIRSFPTKAIGMLQKLVHLLAGHTGLDESLSTVHIPHGVGTMTNMQILSHVEVSKKGDDHELTEVGRLQQLRKLGVVIHGNEAHLLHILLRVIGKLHESLCSLSVRIEIRKTDTGVFRSKSEHDGDDTDDMNTNETFSPPKSLVNLRINGWIRGLPSWIKELHKLSKITLCGTYLTDTDIQLLGELGNLRLLMLRPKSYKDKKLTLRSNKFKRLQFLVIEDSDISNIHFEHNGASILEKIVWTSNSMENLHGIEQLLSLKDIELNSNCDLSRIIHATKANPNHPILTQNPIPKATEATDASNIPRRQ